MSEQVDVLVVGGGIAGATAAIVAAKLGAHVTLIEKQDHLGGSCIYSAGNLLELTGPAEIDRVKALAFYSTPDEILQAYLDGLKEVRGWLAGLGAETEDVSPSALPNCWPNLPGADGVTYYTIAAAANPGPALWSILEGALRASDVEILLSTSMVGLVQTDDRVVGAEVRTRDGDILQISAAEGVILATGGIENDPSLTAAYLPVPRLRPVGNPGNTGDGLRAVQPLGAALWHMSSFYGFWAFDAEQWSTAFPLLFFSPAHMIVDGDGRRFIAESGREPHDALRSVGDFLPDRPNRPSLPAWVIFDSDLLEAGALCRFPSATGYEWSHDNSAEVESGWIVGADSIAKLAEAISLEPTQLARTLATFNRAADAGIDDEFGRPGGSMRPIGGDRFYAMKIWPGVATASGGPQRDDKARVIRPTGVAIAGLYAVGGNGGIWGHLTEHGGGLTDGLVFGAIAARHAVGAN